MLACLQELPIAADRWKVDGGAIALGHPIGATGACIAIALMDEMVRRGSNRGLASLA